MARRRSSVVKRAQADWSGIIRLNPREFWEESPGCKQAIFTKELAFAKELEIEIGSGAGDFLLGAARTKPQTLFVGIEYSTRFIRLARDRLVQEALTNVKLLCTDARSFLLKGLPEKSVDAFHVYFPDPWPRSGHQKKRTLGREGVTLLLSALKPQGKIYFATDHKVYAEKTAEILPEFTEIHIEKAAIAQGADEHYVAPYGTSTHFGKKYLKEGRAIYHFTIAKKE